jgi:uncharacterized protein DUF1353
MPFSNPAGDGPARVVLEQVDDTQFRILAPFKYVDPAGTEYHVPASDLNDPNDVTDLASVPWMVRWLVASYGQHTTAALLHDRLVRPGITLPQRVEADTVFFRALEESGNNWMRHRLMWAAVAIGGTMWSHARALSLVFFGHVLAFWVALFWAIGLLAWLARQPWLDWIPYIDRPPFEQCEQWAAIAAAALFVLGFAWRGAPTADAALSWWMWLAAAVGAGLIVPPCALIAVSVRVVQLIDHLVAVARGAGPQAYEQPTPLKPPDLAKASARKASAMWSAEDLPAG